MFYCKIGDISTSVAWYSPTKQRLENWYKEWIQLKGAQDFDLYLVGNTAEGIYGNSNTITWDVDLVLIGDIKNYKVLKNLLKQSILIGWRHYMMIDMTHNNKLFSQLKNEPFKQIRYSRNFYKKKDNIIEEFTWSGDKTNSLPEGLKELIFSQPPGYNKWIKKQKENVYLGIEKNFKDFLSNSKKIALLSCTKDKLPYKSKVKDLYSASIYFKNTLQKIQKENFDYIYVISAKHGVLELNQEINPYDFTLSQLKVLEKRDWARSILNQLKEKNIDIIKNNFYSFLDKEYLDWLNPYLKNIYL